MDVGIRWLVKRDFSQVAEIDDESFSNPWTADEFVKLMRQR